MSSVRYEVDNEHVYRIIGELNMSTVPELLEMMSSLLDGAGQERVIDLAEVSRSDSAGLALLLDWMSQAQQKNISLSFKNLPAQMQAIIKISGLDSLITD